MSDDTEERTCFVAGVIVCFDSVGSSGSLIREPSNVGVGLKGVLSNILAIRL